MGKLKLLFLFCIFSSTVFAQRYENTDEAVKYVIKKMEEMNSTLENIQNDQDILIDYLRKISEVAEQFKDYEFTEETGKQPFLP